MMIELLSTTGSPSTSGFAVIDWLMPMLVVLAIVLLGILLTFSIRGKVATRQYNAPSPREQIDQVKQSAASRQDSYAFEAHMQETAQRLSAQMSNRIEMLEQLIAEADDRILQLENLTDEQTLEAVEDPNNDSRAETAMELEVQPFLDELDRETDFIDDEADPLTQSVYELADQGQTPIQIARQLDEQVGKVELILALRSVA